MIKAEIITHEGNPGPNWLDHCKTMITPGKVALVLIFGAVLTAVLVVKQQQSITTGTANKQTTTTESQQPELAPSQALEVAPLVISEPESTPATNAAPQSNVSQETPAATTPSAPLTGPAPTSSSSALQPSAKNYNTSTSSRTNTVLQGLQQTVQETHTNVRGLLNGLGL